MAPIVGYAYSNTFTVWPDGFIFINIWLWGTVKVCPKVENICQSILTILANIKILVKKWPKTFEILPLWRNLPQSGHTVRNLYSIFKIRNRSNPLRLREEIFYTLCFLPFHSLRISPNLVTLSVTFSQFSK